MGKIHELNTVLANQIAAGEVIERPASIVKELVENSLDAQSKRIDIIVTKAGLGELRVIDDGIGIAEDDVREAFKRHATSKISTRQDLFRVQTMGFRGEALPSIASVADVVMTTSTGGTSGTMIHLHGGKEAEIKAAPARRGTDVTVKELFFNTPARLKYLKSPHTELSRMVDIINRLALANPDVAISFTHDGKELFRSAGNGNLQQVIAAIYGVKVGRKMLSIHGEDNDFVVDGYVSLPELTRASRQYMTITINHRYVRNYQLSKAIIDGYGSKLMVGRYPVVVLNIDLDPLLVDVNVHPAKREVRLSKEPQLSTLISETIRQKIGKQNLIPDVGERADQLLNVDRQRSTVQENHGHYQGQGFHPQPKPSSAVQQALQPTDTDRNPAAADASDSDVEKPIIIHTRQELEQPELHEFDAKYRDEQVTPFDGQVSGQEQVPDNQPGKTEEVRLAIDDQGDLQAKRFPKLQYIGQLQGTFLLAQASDGLYIIDQHAAQERVNYERFRTEIGQVTDDQQNFLQPVVLNYSVPDALKINEHLDTLAKVGIHLEQFGQNSFLLSSHPTWFIEGQEEETAREMIDWVIDNGKLTVAEFRAKTAIMMSCKRAIKANHRLDDLQAKALLKKLPTCENPFNCPHGRPVLIHFTDTDLEKLFKRIQESHQPFANDFDDHEY